MMRILSAAVLALLLCACAAPRASVAIKTIVIPAHFDRACDEYHYAPAVRVGDTVIVSGIPAAPGADYETRIRAMFERLRMVLEASGATLDDVVEIQTFHRKPADGAAFRAESERFLAIHKQYFRDHYPAWTAVGTNALLADDAPVEMRALAVVGSGKHAMVKRVPQK